MDDFRKGEMRIEDWRKLVDPGAMADPRDLEVVSELAGHLEEMYFDLRRGGASEAHAMDQVRAAGKRLRPSIRRLRWQHEGGWRIWFRAVLVPGFLLSLLYAASKSLLVDVYWERPFLWREAELVLITIALGFCASFFSRELGGKILHRRWATLLVIVPYAVVWCVMGLVVTPMQWAQWTPYRHSVTFVGIASSLLWILLWDLVLPAVGLAIGGAISVRVFSSAAPTLPKRELA